MRILLAAGASLAALALTAPAHAQDEPDYPQMTFGEHGIDPDAIDTAVNPGDDFNAYVNGKWLAENTLPADRSSFGSFNFLQEKADEHIDALITEIAASNPAAGTSERRILDAYEAYLDRAAIDAAGMAPAQPHMQRIYEAEDLTALARLFEDPSYVGLISVGVTTDSKAPDTHAASVGFTGMGMSDRDYYLVDSERNLALREQYKEMLEFMLAKAGYADAASAAEAVYAFEKQVALLEWDRQFFRNPTLTYNELDRAQLQALSPDFPLQAVLEGGGYQDVDRFLVTQIPPTTEEIAEARLSEAELAQIGGGLPAMMDLLIETPLATLKAFMASRFLVANASVLPSDVYEAYFAFQGTALSGVQQPRPIERRALAAVQSYLGEEFAQLYVDRHFPPSSKARMDELVANLGAALRQSFEAPEWMSEQTAREALAKLDAFRPMVGYPEKFETYDGLVMKPGDALGNRQRVLAWSTADNRAKLDQPVDRLEWWLLPQTVNASINVVANTLIFPAAILQPPFFNPDADDAVNYGAIGAGIGHEMGHAFDDSGSRFDSTGTLRNWWTDDDRAAFEARADSMAKLIEAYCPFDNGTLCMTGRQSMGEVLGDVIGLNLAYRAYRNSLAGSEAPLVDGLTGDQRFFIAFAQVWRSLERDEARRSQLVTAAHPLDEFRVNNTVRQMQAWYDAFGVTPDDDLYLAPEDRIRIF